MAKPRGPRGEAGGQRLAEAHRTLSRPLTGAEAHLLGQELLDTGTAESLPPSFVIVSFGASPHRAGTFPEVNVVNVLSNPSATPRTESLRSSTTPRPTTFLLPPFPGNSGWLLVSWSGKVPRCPTTSTGTPGRLHDLSGRGWGVWRKHTEVR